MNILYKKKYQMFQSTGKVPEKVDVQKDGSYVLMGEDNIKRIKSGFKSRRTVVKSKNDDGGKKYNQQKKASERRLPNVDVVAGQEGTIDAEGNEHRKGYLDDITVGKMAENYLLPGIEVMGTPATLLTEGYRHATGKKHDYSLAVPRSLRELYTGKEDKRQMSTMSDEWGFGTVDKETGIRHGDNVWEMAGNLGIDVVTDPSMLFGGGKAAQTVRAGETLVNNVVKKGYKVLPKTASLAERVASKVLPDVYSYNKVYKTGIKELSEGLAANTHKPVIKAMKDAPGILKGQENIDDIFSGSNVRAAIDDLPIAGTMKKEELDAIFKYGVDMKSKGKTSLAHEKIGVKSAKDKILDIIIPSRKTAATKKASYTKFINKRELGVAEFYANNPQVKNRLNILDRNKKANSPFETARTADAYKYKYNAQTGLLEGYNKLPLKTKVALMRGEKGKIPTATIYEHDIVKLLQGEKSGLITESKKAGKASKLLYRKQDQFKNKMYGKLGGTPEERGVRTDFKTKWDDMNMRSEATINYNNLDDFSKNDLVRRSSALMYTESKPGYNKYTNFLARNDENAVKGHLEGQLYDDNTKVVEGDKGFGIHNTMLGEYNIFPTEKVMKSLTKEDYTHEPGHVIEYIKNIIRKREDYGDDLPKDYLYGLSPEVKARVDKLGVERYTGAATGKRPASRKVGITKLPPKSNRPNKVILDREFPMVDKGRGNFIYGKTGKKIHTSELSREGAERLGEQAKATQKILPEDVKTFEGDAKIEEMLETINKIADPLEREDAQHELTRMIQFTKHNAKHTKNAKIFDDKVASGEIDVLTNGDDLYHNTDILSVLGAFTELDLSPNAIIKAWERNAKVGSPVEFSTYARRRRLHANEMTFKNDDLGSLANRDPGNFMLKSYPTNKDFRGFYPRDIGSPTVNRDASDYFALPNNEHRTAVTGIGIGKSSSHVHDRGATTSLMAALNGQTGTYNEILTTLSPQNTRFMYSHYGLTHVEKASKATIARAANKQLEEKFGKLVKNGKDLSLEELAKYHASRRRYPIAGVGHTIYEYTPNGVNAFTPENAKAVQARIEKLKGSGNLFDIFKKSDDPEGLLDFTKAIENKKILDMYKTENNIKVNKFRYGGILYKKS